MSPHTPDDAAHARDAREILAWLDEKPTLSRHVQAARRLDELNQTYPDLFSPLRLLMVRNFTIEPIEPLVKVAGFRAGLAVEVAYSSYEPAADEHLGDLLRAEPAIVVLALRLEELSPALVEDFLGPERAAASELADATIEQVLALAARIRSSSAAPIMVQNFVMPVSPSAGLADTQYPTGQLNLVRRMNIELARRVTDVPGLYVMDVDHLFAGIGLRETVDERGARTAGAPLSQTALRALADSLVRHILSLKGPGLKCVVVDCDNTLWGGVVGEDGVAGLLMGDTGPGRPHRDLQRRLRDLRRRGIVLAICSKNEEKDVVDVLRNHPDCVLREEDFAAMRIDWNDKAENIESIAKELNLGLEDMLYIDDSPVECEWIGQRLPALHVLQWTGGAGQDPLSGLPGFDSLVLTDEDRSRTELYRSDAKRKEAARSADTIEDYLRTLELVAVVGSARPEHIPRLAQLTQRTNQFNLTTRRYDDAAMRETVNDHGARVVWLDLQDRFGANGIVGCGIVRLTGDAAVIDSLMLSCRVIGRGAEGVLVSKLAALARDAGARLLVGEYIPSERNGQVAGLYTRLGFSGPDVEGDVQRWTWTISSGLPAAPDWIEVIDRDGKGA